MIFIFLPQTAFAHASLIQAYPSPDSHLDASPNQVVLTFNERLENTLFYIKVLNQNGESVTANSARMNQQQFEITLQLPELQDGLYTVTYKVISADGHPITEAYVFTVGKTAVSPNPASQQIHFQDEISSNVDLKQVLAYISRVFYFFALLLMAGWTFWGLIIRFRPDAMQKSDFIWSSRLLRIFMVSLIFFIAADLPVYLDSFRVSDLVSLLFGTWMGISWAISLLVAASGFVLLHRWKWLDAVWVVLLLAAKSINGHAMGFEPIFRTVALDFIHLLAASIWVGGLFYIMIHWRRHKEAISGFLNQLSNYALISIVILVATGIFSTLIYLPKLNYILYTQWGKLLILKCVLVSLVIVVGAIIRFLQKRKRRHPGMILKIDITLMLLIVVIASIFTVLNPKPVNQPLYWHAEGDAVQMTAKVTPNAPGNNIFSVDVWLPEGSGKPKDVQLFLKYQDDEEVAPIQVPLAAGSVENALDISGMEPFNYRAEGAYIPFSGRWMMEIRVMDANDHETVYQKEATIY